MLILPEQDYSLYIHIPFCHTRCTYCAFNTYAGLEHVIPEYVSALCEEVAWVAHRLETPALHTIFFGGGTPSVLTPAQIAEVLTAVARHFRLNVDAEITIEANPRTLSADYCSQILAIGVNRLSIGAQSAQQSELKLFNRQHGWSDVVDAVDAARAGGFENISLDAIYGAPGQSATGWRDTLSRMIALAPSHVSLYAMGIERDTPLHKWVAEGRVMALDSDVAAGMYDTATALLGAAGFEQYEISNWALPGQACLHNMQYWRSLPYVGIGAGAYGFVGSTRYSIVDNPTEYIQRMSKADSTEAAAYSPAQNHSRTETLTFDQMRSETMILGLRLLSEGVSRQRFETRYGQPIESIYGAVLSQLHERGLLELDDDRIRLSRQARLVANQALIEFV